MTLRMRKIYRTAAPLVLALGALAPAQAAVTNGSFESGLTGWSQILNGGTITTVGSHTAVAPTTTTPPTFLPKDGSFFALLKAGDNNDEVTLFQTTLAANAGDVLSGWVFFDSGDSEKNDKGSVKIYNGSALLATPFDVEGNGSGGGHVPLETGWVNWSYTFLTSGTNFKLEGVVRNTANDDNDSYLGMDDIKLTSEVSNVPEPTSMSLLAGGALGLFGARRRRRQQPAA